MKGRPGPLEESILPKIYTVTLFLSLPQRALCLFTRVTALGKRLSLDLSRLSLDLTLVLTYPQGHCGPPSRVAIYGDQRINGVLAQVPLTVGPVGLQTHPMIISPVSERIIGIGNILSSWWNLHIGSRTYGVEGYLGGKGQVEVTRTVST